MSEKRLDFIDSTLRDGQETLIGGRLRTQLIVPILEDLDAVGFQSIEAWGGGTFHSSLARLHENPWDRLRTLKKKLRRTPLQMLIRGRFLVGDRPFNYGFVERFLKRAADLGVDIVRLVDPLNDLESLAKVAHLAKNAGLNVQLSVLCSDSADRLRYYEQLISKSDLSEADFLGIFNPWGDLSPATATKVVELLRNGKEQRVFAHIHNLRGAGTTSSLAAVKNGVSIFDTCFSGFSYEGSLPSVESFVGSFESEIPASGLDLEAFVNVSHAFMRLRNESLERLPAVMQPTSWIEKSLQEIAPTISSLLAQRLVSRRMTEDAGLREEVTRIMDDVGLVSLVAPVSEIVVRQAALNLHSKSRYAEFTDEFLRLIRGELGAISFQRALIKRLRTNLDLGTSVKMEGIKENIPLPQGEGKTSEDDLLCFALYPHEFIETKSASLSSTKDSRKEIVAATLALLAQTSSGKTSEHEELAVKVVENYTRWRNALRLDNSDSKRTRGFVQEPF